MPFTAQKITTMQQQSKVLLDNRPSVFRIGALVLLLRLVSGLLGFGMVVLGVAILLGRNFMNLEIEIYATRLEPLQLGIFCIVLGLLLQTINWLCHVIRKRNWYVLESFEVLDWVSALSLPEEDTSPIPGEKELMASSDGNIVLTSHRLIDRQEIMDRDMRLNDILNVEIRHKKQSYYKVLTGFFSMVLVLLSLVMLLYPIRPGDESWGYLVQVLGLVTFFVVLSVLCLVSWTRPYLVVTGKYRNIAVDVHAFKRESLKSFVAALQKQRLEVK